MQTRELSKLSNEKMKLSNNENENDESEKYIKLLKNNLFEKDVAFPKIPFIYLEPMCDLIIDNPYFEELKDEEYPCEISYLGKDAQIWKDYSTIPIITEEQKIMNLISEAKKILRDNLDFFEGKLKINKWDKQSIKKTLLEINDFVKKLYYVYVFYLDESFKTSKKEIKELLAKTRFELSSFMENKVWALQNILLNKIADLCNLQKEDIDLASTEELTNLLNGEKLPEELNNRSIMILQIKNKKYIILDKSAEKLLDYLENQDPRKKMISEAKKRNSFEGSAASKGIVRGEVLVCNELGYENFKLDPKKENIIFVTPMTRPEMTNSLKKVKAIITDEGGITCHASIIARELKIPCIIGTRIGTRVLRDGDLVEVDADKGIVNILEDEKDNDDKMEEITNGEKITQRGLAYPAYVLPIKGSFIQIEDYLGKSYKNLIARFQEGYADYSYLKEDFKNILKTINEKIKKNPKFLEKVERDYNSQFKQVLEEYQKAKKQKPNEEELIDLYSLVIKLNQYSIGIGHVIEPLSILKTHDLKETLAQTIKDPKELTNTLNILTTPCEKSFTNKYEEELLDVPEKDDKKIKRFIKKYSWIKNSYAGSSKLTKKDLADERISVKKLKRNYFKKIIESRKKIIKDFDITENAQEIARQLRMISLWQDNRKINLLKSISEMDWVLNKISKNFEVSIHSLRWMTQEEIIEKKFNSKEFLKSLKEREKYFIWFFDKKKKNYQRWFVGKEAKEIYNKFNVEKKFKGDALFGMGASTGSAIGEISICKTFDDIKKFGEGDILVTSMTRPEFVSAMKKAAAIVTDEGGITCHAAIISRELGIPCVIGTKNATTFFNNGDLVEVKADHGAVKILEKNE